MKGISIQCIKILLISILIIKSSNIYSQTTDEVKYTLLTKYDSLTLSEIVDLIENYNSKEYEIITLKMERLRNITRFIQGENIYFGKWETSYSNNKLEERVNYGKHNVSDLYFSTSVSPKLTDKYKKYSTFNIYIDKQTLYKTILEIGNRNDYKLYSTKIVPRGILKTFEYQPLDKKFGFFIQTLDGDNLSKISFYLAY
jgi:hypothetical protein